MESAHKTRYTYFVAKAGRLAISLENGMQFCAVWAVPFKKEGKVRVHFSTCALRTAHMVETLRFVQAFVRDCAQSECVMLPPKHEGSGDYILDIQFPAAVVPTCPNSFRYADRALRQLVEIMAQRIHP